MISPVIFFCCLYVQQFHTVQSSHDNYYQRVGTAYRPQKQYPSNAYRPSNYHQQRYYPKEPACAKNTTASYCLEDNEYPGYEIQEAIYKYYQEFQPLYADVVVSTANSVENLKKFEEETYLCPSDIKYARPLRAKNLDGKWKIIVNVEKYYQHTRIETCIKPKEPCPLVPSCYSTFCVQKSIYHRFVIYDPYDYYSNPFRIDIFRLPAACSCLVGDFMLQSKY